MKIKVDNFCQICRKRIKEKERIEIGFSVMTGNIAVCSKECLKILNCGGKY